MTQLSERAIARVCHEANRALCTALEDHSQVSWDSAPRWQKDSSVEGVRAALAGASAEDLHEAWCEFKRDDGWRYGPVKDAEAKTHPCLVRYAALPPEQQLKDHLFAAVVAALNPTREH